MSESGRYLGQFFDVAVASYSGRILPSLFNDTDSAAHRLDRHYFSLVSSSVPRETVRPGALEPGNGSMAGQTADRGLFRAGIAAGRHGLSAAAHGGHSCADRPQERAGQHLGWSGSSTTDGSWVRKDRFRQHSDKWLTAPLTRRRGPPCYSGILPAAHWSPRGPPVFRKD